jgi:hypothetical protein
MRGSRGRSFCSIAPARRRAWDSAADIDPRTSSLTIADQSRIRRKAGISPQNNPGADLSLFRMIALDQGHLPRGVWRWNTDPAFGGDSRGDAPRPVDTISLDMGSIRALRPLKLQGLEPAAMS